MKQRPAIVSKPESTLSLQDWLAAVKQHEYLVMVTGRTARNPATGRVVILRDRPDLVDVVLDDRCLGRMQWEQEYFPAVTFDAAVGCSDEMMTLLYELARSMDAVVGEYPDDRGL